MCVYTNLLNVQLRITVQRCTNNCPVNKYTALSKNDNEVYKRNYMIHMQCFYGQH